MHPLKGRKSVGHFLRAWREIRGHSLRDAAERIGISHAQLGRIERGAQEYRQSQFEALAYLYGCHVIHLLEPPPAWAKDTGRVVKDMDTSP